MQLTNKNSKPRQIFSVDAGLQGVITLLMLAATVAIGFARDSVSEAPLVLRDTVSPSAFHDSRSGPVQISGAARDGNVLVRVTTSLGESSTARVPCLAGKFACHYPNDFQGARPLVPEELFIDATTDSDFDASRPGHFQGEITVLVDTGRGAAPILSSVFTDDLLDSRGRRDEACAQWPAMRTLANLYMRSRAAHMVGVGGPEFDLSKKTDLEWFKNNLSLYEFDYRDRDWSKPLNHRVARAFWQSVWNTWFNASNDNPLDGNPANTATTNYLPYVFANDFADILIMELMRLPYPQSHAAHLTNICREATQNLLAMQYRGPGNFALPDLTGKRENYTAGAFHYGMFKDGDFMTEGNGWFYVPKFRDYEHGGVLNGRAVWALGESLSHDPQSPLSPRICDAIALALKFCLHDGAAGGYVKHTPAGRAYWRDAGEHAYLLLGMLSACEVAPELKLQIFENSQTITLREACLTELDALVDLEKPTHQWAIYPDIDSMAIAALAEGALMFPDAPDAGRWRQAAAAAADAWLAAKVNPQECAGGPVHFGLRVAPDQMTYIWPGTDHPRYFYYQTGHWIHALANLYALTGDERYRRRAEAMVSYLCGNNPWQVRLFNELGGVYNWTDDLNHDGVQDLLKQDMYPESTAFCQIGIMRLWQAIDKNRVPSKQIW
jgi:hypothetical protein